MDTFDLSDLTPEDLKMLQDQIASRNAAPSGDDGDRMQKLCDALEFAVKEIETLGQRVDHLQTLVMEDLFGALEKQYKDNARSMSISGLESKYGEAIAPHMGALQALAPDAKIFDELFDLIEQARSEGGEGWDEDTFVRGQITDLGDRLGKAMASRQPAEGPKEETAPEASATVTVEKEAPPKREFSETARRAAQKMI